MWEGRKGARALAVALACAALATPLIASGQTPEEKAGARAAATEGAKAFKAGEYQRAIDFFRRAESLVHAPPHLLYMARAHAKLGEFVRARELYIRIIRESLTADAPAAFRRAQDSAREEMGEAEGKIARLTITVKGLEAGAQAQVTIDGKQVPAALLGVPYPVDPGQHTVVATAPGYTQASKQVTVEEAGSGSVELAVEVDPEAAPGAPPATDAGPPEAAEPRPGATSEPGAGVAMDSGSSMDSGSGMAVPAYIALGVGAVGLGAGVLFTVQSAAARSDADDLFQRCAGNGVGGQCRSDDPLARQVAEKDDDAASAQTFAIVGYAVGGVGLAVGATLLILDLTSGATAKAEQRERAGVTPWLGVTPGGGSMGLTGRF